MLNILVRDFVLAKAKNLTFIINIIYNKQILIAANYITNKKADLFKIGFLNYHKSVY